MTTQKKTDANLKDNAPDGIALSDGEQAQARKDGAKDDVKDAAKDTHRYLTDGNLPGDPPANQYIGHDDIMQFEPLLSLAPDAFDKRVNGKDADVPEEKVYGLLGLERNGQNRTPFVKSMMKRLGFTKAEELPGGGPAYTNDVTPTSAL
jgi:hypothetical protein